MAASSDDSIGMRGSTPEQHSLGVERPHQSARAQGLANGRTIENDDGQWRVYELESGPYDRRSGRSLIFESDGVLRRVRDYPEEWRALSDAELMEVSWRR
jgi:hypothetical protein